MEEINFSDASYARKMSTYSMNLIESSRKSNCKSMRIYKFYHQHFVGHPIAQRHLKYQLSVRDIPCIHAGFDFFSVHIVSSHF